MEKWERCRQILEDNYKAFRLAGCTLDIIEVTYDAIAAQEREKYAVLLAAVDAGGCGLVDEWRTLRCPTCTPRSPREGEVSMPQWTLDEGFVAWLRTTMSPEQVSMLDLNGVLDDIYSGYLAGIAAERARLAPVIEAANKAARWVLPDSIENECDADLMALREALRNAGRLTEGK